MKKFALILIISAAASLLGCSKNSSEARTHNTNNVQSMAAQAPASSAKPDVQTAPEFTLKDTKGKNISLSDFKGKVVVIDFWATWCPPCRRGIPDLISIKKEYKNKVAIIGISLDVQTKKDVVPFMKKMGMNYPVLYATNKVVRDYGNIDAIPTSFVINKDGQIVNHHVGLTPKEVYIDEINKLLKKS